MAKMAVAELQDSEKLISRKKNHIISTP